MLAGLKKNKYSITKEKSSGTARSGVILEEKRREGDSNSRVVTHTRFPVLRPTRLSYLGLDSGIKAEIFRLVDVVTYPTIHHASVRPSTPINIRQVFIQMVLYRYNRIQGQVFMNRIKVINEPAELVSVFRAVDTDLKREIFKEISVDWKTVNFIEEKFGKDGRKALRIFEKMKLVETRWQQPNDNTSTKPVKAYHTYYSSFHINTSASVFEISDIIAAAGIPDKEYKKIEDEIIIMVEKEDDGAFSGDVAEKLEVSAIMLKALIKRSAKLEYRGHRIEIYVE